jgi:hypothetical protein
MLDEFTISSETAMKLVSTFVGEPDMKSELMVLGRKELKEHAAKASIADMLEKCSKLKCRHS